MAAYVIGLMCALALFGAWLALESDHGPAAGLCICLLSAIGVAAVLASVV